MKTLCIELLIVMGYLGSAVIGQEETPSTGQAEQPEAVEFVDQYERRFEQRDPAIGALFNDLQAFDDQGKPFQLHDSRGQYRVIVFGCLT